MVRTGGKLGRNIDLLLILVSVQLAVTGTMAGVVWMVQLVTYPQFLTVTPADFPRFHTGYTSAVSPLVGPLMIAELGLSILTAWRARRTRFRFTMYLGAALTVALWAITFFVQVPLHDSLSEEWSEPAIRELVSGNWVRTILWTTRITLLLVVLGLLMKPNGVLPSV